MRERIRLIVRSIRFRLALWFVLILAVVLAAFSVFVYVRQENDLNNETLDRLNMMTRKWEAYLNYGGREFLENRRLLPGAAAEQAQLLREYDIMALIGLDGDVVQKAGPISDQDVQRLLSAGKQVADPHDPFSFQVIEASAKGNTTREEYLFVIVPISFERSIIGFFVLGSPIDPTGQMKRLVITLLLGSLATLGLALAGGYWLADRAMRPVQTITRAAREIGETDLSRRLNLGTRDELGELADTFDGMLARLQAAFDRQRQFTADASHELRTPLTIVGLEAGRALAARRSAQEYERALSVIQSENEFMSRLVNNLLTLSRMDAGQAALNMQPLDLSDVALDVVERLSPLAERRGVELSTGDLPELPVSGDQQYLSQMIANLVENAIKYSRPQGARVQVETGQGDEGRHERAWVRVSDNGPGIPAEHLSHLFDRFYQVDRARTHNLEQPDSNPGDGHVTAGSGLGLSIVQWIAHAHSGDVRVESQLGEGSVFTVWLPLLEPV